MHITNSQRLSMGATTALGIGVGTALGVASDAVARGVSFGAAGGLVAGVIMAARARNGKEGRGRA